MSLLSRAEIERIAEETKAQADCGLWLAYRKELLTASRFGTVLNGVTARTFLHKREVQKQKKRKRQTKDEAFQSIVDSLNKPVPESLPIKYGRINEKYAIRFYETLTKSKVLPTGLWITPDGLLGASPDGLVREQGAQEGWTGILECKCPFYLRKVKGYSDLCANYRWPSFFKAGTKQIKRTHPYFHQIQGQLYATGAPWCDFLMWTPHYKIRTRVYPDAKWREKAIKRLETFARRYRGERATNSSVHVTFDPDNRTTSPVKRMRFTTDGRFLHSDQKNQEVQLIGNEVRLDDQDNGTSAAND